MQKIILARQFLKNETDFDNTMKSPNGIFIQIIEQVYYRKCQT